MFGIGTFCSGSLIILSLLQANNSAKAVSRFSI
jgi:hypothetical protein